MGWMQPRISGTSIVPPLFATGRLGQLVGVAGAAAGARQILPALPAFPQTRPVGQPSPEEQLGRQNSPVESWTHALPVAQLPPFEQDAVHTPPGKSALSTQVRPLPQLGLKTAEPRFGTVPVHAGPSAASATRRHDRGIRTRTLQRSRSIPGRGAQGTRRTDAPRGAPHAWEGVQDTCPSIPHPTRMTWPWLHSIQSTEP